MGNPEKQNNNSEGIVLKTKLMLKKLMNKFEKNKILKNNTGKEITIKHILKNKIIFFYKNKKYEINKNKYKNKYTTDKLFNIKYTDTTLILSLKNGFNKKTKKPDKLNKDNDKDKKTQVPVVKQKTKQEPKTEIETAPEASTLDYIDPKKNEAELKTFLEEKNYPSDLFIKNVTQKEKYNSSKIKSFTKTINKIYKEKQKEKPIIYIDNENGAVQRVSEYTLIGNNLEIQNDLQKKFNVINGAGKLENGEPSIRSFEKLLDKKTKKEQDILMKKYAKLRIAQEKSIGMNSIQLVLDESEDKGVINSRGFKNKDLRESYGNILIEEAKNQSMQVVLKHFPGHKGFDNPHNTSAGIRRQINDEMQTFLNILKHNKDKTNITVMLGHIQMEIKGWSEKDNNNKPLLASESKIMVDKIKEVTGNHNIKFISDDIEGMTAAKNKKNMRENAKKAGIMPLN